LSNGQVLAAGEMQGGMRDEIQRHMIRRTVQEHLKKEAQYAKRGIKVLSLFFIDKVANYRSYDGAGNAEPGKFARWFEEIYGEETERSPKLNNGGTEASATATISEAGTPPLHDGYFSQDNKGKLKDTGGETQADNDTYSLIMRDKERLLDIATPLRFIFSHSALREGWDNPNVFQICTLNETKSDLKKRQEIGRGLRLCVDGSGNRVHDAGVNRLTVVANECYEDFAAALQKEIEADCGVEFGGRIKNKRDREKLAYRKGFELDPKFVEIWDRIKFKTKYNVSYKTAELIILAGKAVKDMPEVGRPSIRNTRMRVTMSEDDGIRGEFLSENWGKYDDGGTEASATMPDVVSYIQNKTELTRKTVFEIIRQSGRMRDILVNPQLFMDSAAVAIRKTLHELMTDGIKYEKIGDRVYEMNLFDDADLEFYLDDFTHMVRNADKTIYAKHIPLDSSVESKFANDCESSEHVEFYFKLPGKFRIPTPLGDYIPDWAVVFKDERKVYFVAETKDAREELRESAKLKIKCGTAHFNEFKTDGVEYRKINRVGELRG